jgi:predicted DNA-binding antitoxin AbrB/MazE fold protein
MTKQVEAVYENGLLRPLEPLPLVEQQHVQVTISDLPPDSLASMIDHSFLEKARREVEAAASVPTHEEVRRMTARDTTSWAEAIIAERRERF